MWASTSTFNRLKENIGFVRMWRVCAVQIPQHNRIEHTHTHTGLSNMNTCIAFKIAKHCQERQDYLAGGGLVV